MIETRPKLLIFNELSIRDTFALSDAEIREPLRKTRRLLGDVGLPSALTMRLLVESELGLVMSWMPLADPILGNKRSCDALELVVVPRVRDLGEGFEVRRALPSDKRQMVGPFKMSADEP
jgi:hypothetical protein